MRVKLRYRSGEADLMNPREDLWKRAVARLPDKIVPPPSQAELRWLWERPEVQKALEELLEEEEVHGTKEDDGLADTLAECLEFGRNYAEHIAGLRSLPTGLIGEPPEWWQRHSREVMAKLEKDRRVFLSTVGLKPFWIGTLYLNDEERTRLSQTDSRAELASLIRTANARQKEHMDGPFWQGPLTRKEALDWLTHLRAEQRREGDYINLWVPVLGEDDEPREVRVWKVWRGRAVAEPRTADGELDLNQFFRQRNDPCDERDQPLFRLAVFIDRLRVATAWGGRRVGPRPLGVVDEPGSLDHIAALFYTLCGEVPTLPTLTISWRTSFDPFLRRNDPDQIAFTIHVAIPDVQPRDVAAIYAWKRAEIFSVESDEERSGQGSLRGSPWAERLVFFVESQPQGGRRRWSEIHKAFAEKYPEQPYRSPESMKVAYYRRCRQRPRVAELCMMLDE